MTKENMGAGVDAVDLLMSQHRDVEQMWTQAEAAHSGGDQQMAADLGQQIIAMLSQHDAIETELLYPALRSAGDDGDELAQHSLEEHQQVRELLKKADGSLTEADGWAALAEAMADVMHHVEEEESKVFPRLRQAHEADLYELGSAMKAAMKLAPTHPHPSTPDNPAGAAVVGGVAAIVDRVRDAIRKAS